MRIRTLSYLFTRWDPQRLRQNEACLILPVKYRRPLQNVNGGEVKKPAHISRFHNPILTKRPTLSSVTSAILMRRDMWYLLLRHMCVCLTSPIRAAAHCAVSLPFVA